SGVLWREDQEAVESGFVRPQGRMNSPSNTAFQRRTQLGERGNQLLAQTISKLCDERGDVRDLHRVVAIWRYERKTNYPGRHGRRGVLREGERDRLSPVLHADSNAHLRRCMAPKRRPHQSRFRTSYPSRRQELVIEPLRLRRRGKRDRLQHVALPAPVLPDEYRHPAELELQRLDRLEPLDFDLADHRPAAPRPQRCWHSPRSRATGGPGSHWAPFASVRAPSARARSALASYPLGPADPPVGLPEPGRSTPRACARASRSYPSRP